MTAGGCTSPIDRPTSSWATLAGTLPSCAASSSHAPESRTASSTRARWAGSSPEAGSGDPLSDCAVRRTRVAPPTSCQSCSLGAAWYLARSAAPEGRRPGGTLPRTAVARHRAASHRPRAPKPWPARGRHRRVKGIRKVVADDADAPRGQNNAPTRALTAAPMATSSTDVPHLPSHRDHDVVQDADRDGERSLAHHERSSSGRVGRHQDGQGQRPPRAHRRVLPMARISPAPITNPTMVPRAP